APSQADPRVGTADGAVDDRLIQNPRGELSALGPNARRRRQRLGFARDLAAKPIADADEAMASQATQSRYAMHNHVRQVRLGQHPDDRFAGAAGYFALDRGQDGQLGPELLGIAQPMARHLPQRRMTFGQNEGTPARFQ